MARGTAKRKRKREKQRERGFGYGLPSAKSGGGRTVRKQGGKQKASGGVTKGGRRVEITSNIIKIQRAEPKVVQEKKASVPKPEPPKSISQPQQTQIF